MTRYTVEATRTVVKRVKGCKTPGVKRAFESLVERLRRDPQFTVPDKRTIWKRAFPRFPNHRHADLPSGWRASWTIIQRDGKAVVILIFVGTHKDYEKTYGFRKQ